MTPDAWVSNGDLQQNHWELVNDAESRVPHLLTEPQELLRLGLETILGKHLIKHIFKKVLSFSKYLLSI